MNCPHCQTPSPINPASTSQAEILLEICPHCGLAWLDFHAHRPEWHRKLDRLFQAWEQRLHANCDLDYLEQAA